MTDQQKKDYLLEIAKLLEQVATSGKKNDEALLKLIETVIDRVQILEGRLDMLLAMYMSDKEEKH